MSDYASGLPIRTEADGTDERVHVKVVDGVTPSQRMSVDTDLNAHVEIHGNDPAGVDRVVRTSELGALTPDGVYHATNNTKPGNVGLVVAARAASPGDSDQTQRLTAITSGSVHALDIALHDESGVPYSETNPVPVIMAESEGAAINDYLKSSAVAAGATVNHDYTVTLLKTLYVTQVDAAASGKMKIELEIETGIATGVFTSKFVKFNSTATPNCVIELREPIAVAAGVRVRLARTNLDNQAQDLYSTIEGHEV